MRRPAYALAKKLWNVGGLIGVPCAMLAMLIAIIIPGPKE